MIATACSVDGGKAVDQLGDPALHQVEVVHHQAPLVGQFGRCREQLGQLSGDVFGARPLRPRGHRNRLLEPGREHPQLLVDRRDRVGCRRVLAERRRTEGHPQQALTVGADRDGLADLDGTTRIVGTPPAHMGLHLSQPVGLGHAAHGE